MKMSLFVCAWLITAYLLIAVMPVLARSQPAHAPEAAYQWNADSGY